MSAPLRVNTVGIVGNGRVGSIMAAALADAGYRVIGVADRSRPPAPDELAADLLLLAVPDDALAALVAGLAGEGAFHEGQIVAHTSGAHGVAVLAPAVARGARPLALHPAMTFVGDARGADASRRSTAVGLADLERLRKGISFGLTAPADVRPAAEALVRDLGGTPEWIPEERRGLYHAALAHGANHLVTLVNDAMDRLREAGVAQPERVLDPLLHAALDNTLRLGDAALTGPVSRGDAGTVRRHVEVLTGAAPEAAPAYLVLARRTAARALAAGRLSPDEAATLLDALRREDAGMSERGGEPE
jgi:predicted short-subunit dehydrogenase-like oxidoreductase (DUF2520 family)